MKMQLGTSDAQFIEWEYEGKNKNNKLSVNVAILITLVTFCCHGDGFLLFGPHFADYIYSHLENMEVNTGSSRSHPWGTFAWGWNFACLFQFPDYGVFSMFNVGRTLLMWCAVWNEHGKFQPADSV